MDTLQKRIKFALDLAKKKPTELARHIGISESAISQWVNGPTKTINSVHILKVSDFLGVNAQWLASGEGSPTDIKADNIDDDSITNDEQKWLKLIRRMNHNQRTALFLSLTATLDLDNQLEKATKAAAL